VDWPLGVVLAIVMILAACGFANPGSTFPWIWQLLIIVFFLIFAVGLLLYACVRVHDKNQRQRQNNISGNDHGGESQASSHVPSTSGDERTNANEDKDYNPGDKVGLGTLAYESFKGCMEVLKHYDSLITAFATLLLMIITAGLVVVTTLIWQTSKQDQRPWVGANVTLLNEPSANRLGFYYRLLNVLNT